MHKAVDDLDDPTSIIIGTPTNGIVLSVLYRSHPTSDDYWDGNWLQTAIKVSVGSFRGRVLADLRAEELQSFCSQLRAMSESLNGRADFDTMEGWLTLQMQIDRLGHIAVTGTIRDDSGVGNTLKFDLEIDQTFLRDIISSLDNTLTKFPVIGKP